MTKEGFKEEEIEFLEDSTKSFIISLGMKRQGKTFLLLKYLQWALLNGKYEEYHLILPQFGHERDGAYQFLVDMKNVFIYDKYHQVVCDKMLTKMQSKHIFFCIDDATGELLQNFDTSMTKLLTCNEHGKSACIWICIHSAKRVLPPLARQMLNYFFLYKVNNVGLLKGLWEEYFSLLYRNFESFLQVYQEAMAKKDKNAIMFALSDKHDLEGISDWMLINTDFSSEFKKKKEKKHKQDVNNSEKQCQGQGKKGFCPFFLRQKNKISL